MHGEAKGHEAKQSNTNLTMLKKEKKQKCNPISYSDLFDLLGPRQRLLLLNPITRQRKLLK